MKIIKFISNLGYDNTGKPVPMKRTLPDWYKKAESTYPIPSENRVGAGLKKCMPYTDAMIAGYGLTFPTDVYVKTTENGDVDISWDRETPAGEFIMERPKELGATMPRPHGFAPNHLVFTGRWGWKTPRGYSVLVTHPFNRVDMPFHTVTALMDSDEFHAAGNIPFFIRENWEGVIKKGTVFAQLLPVKRDSWKMVENDQGLADIVDLHVAQARNDATDYKKTMWHRKKYD